MEKEDYALVVVILCFIGIIGIATYDNFSRSITKKPSTEISQKEPSVMEWYKVTQPYEPIKFEDGVNFMSIKVEFIIEEDCGKNNHCVSYIKEENGPHFRVGSMINPRVFSIGKSYDCWVSIDDTGFTAGVIQDCKQFN